MTGIYRIKNTITGKCYIGSAVDIKDRWDKHNNALNKNKHHSIKLQRSYNKHGVNNFIFEIIKECEPVKEIMLEREQHYIDLYDSYYNGYNCTKNAGSTLGYRHTDDTKKKISIKQTGKKHSEETKLIWSQQRKGKNVWSKGKVLTKETKEKMKEARIGRKNPKHNSLSILQYDLSNNFIKEWRDLVSLKEAGFNSGYISQVCYGRSKSSHGFKWSFKLT